MKEDQKTLALERIERLVQLAEEAWPQEKGLARRYLELAWRLKLRHRVRLPTHLRGRFCRKCRSPLKPGVSCRVRVRAGRVVRVCLECGHLTRLPLRGEKGDRINKRRREDGKDVR
ncbi:MAG: hypothetical protein QXM46_05175 [Candidatus Hadarchaeales archaeon]